MVIAIASRPAILHRKQRVLDGRLSFDVEPMGLRNGRTQSRDLGSGNLRQRFRFLSLYDQPGSGFRQ
jgi:hypothetical protein